MAFDPLEPAYAAHDNFSRELDERLCNFVVALLECCQSKVKLLARFPKEGKARIPLAFKTYAMFAPTKGGKHQIAAIKFEMP